MKNIIILVLFSTFVGCYTKPKEINNNPLIINVDSAVLAPYQYDFEQYIDNPSRGKIRVVISNYTDSVKTFEITVKEK